MDTPTDITCSAKQYLQQYFTPLENSTDQTDWKIWINEDTYLLTENRNLWGSLCDAKCWGDLEAYNSSETKIDMD